MGNPFLDITANVGKLLDNSLAADTESVRRKYMNEAYNARVRRRQSTRKLFDTAIKVGATLYSNYQDSIELENFAKDKYFIKSTPITRVFGGTEFIPKDGGEALDMEDVRSLREVKKIKDARMKMFGEEDILDGGK